MCSAEEMSEFPWQLLPSLLLPTLPLSLVNRQTDQARSVFVNDPVETHQVPPKKGRTQLQEHLPVTVGGYFILFQTNLWASEVTGDWGGGSGISHHHQGNVEGWKTTSSSFHGWPPVLGCVFLLWPTQRRGWLREEEWSLAGLAPTLIHRVSIKWNEHFSPSMLPHLPACVVDAIHTGADGASHMISVAFNSSVCRSKTVQSSTCLLTGFGCLVWEGKSPEGILLPHPNCFITSGTSTSPLTSTEAAVPSPWWLEWVCLRKPGLCYSFVHHFYCIGITRIFILVM